MATMTDERLDQRLLEWADWFGRGTSYGIGYPSASVEYKILKYGTCIKSAHQDQTPENKKAEEIELHVKALSAYDSILSEALRNKYFSSYYDTNESLGRKLGIGARTFEKRVQTAKIWLMGRLSNRE